MTTPGTLAHLRTRLDSWPLIILFGVIYFASQVLIGNIVHPLGADMLIVQTTLSADQVRGIFAKWESAGLLPVYASHYRYDMIHPLWYGLFLAALLAKGLAANRAGPRLNLLLLVPFVAAGCDVVENLVHLGYIADRATITPANVLVSNGAALLKWMLAAGSLLAIAALAVRARRGGPG